MPDNATTLPPVSGPGPSIPLKPADDWPKTTQGGYGGRFHDGVVENGEVVHPGIRVEETPAPNPTTDIVECREWRHSHPTTVRWKAYYAAFEEKHGRPSGEDEFDPKISRFVDVVFSVIRSELGEVLK